MKMQTMHQNGTARTRMLAVLCLMAPLFIVATPASAVMIEETLDSAGINDPWEFEYDGVAINGGINMVSGSFQFAGATPWVPENGGMVAVCGNAGSCLDAFSATVTYGVNGATMMVDIGLGDVTASNFYVHAVDDQWIISQLLIEGSVVTAVGSEHFSVTIAQDTPCYGDGSMPGCGWFHLGGFEAKPLDVSHSQVPEPGTLALLTLGLAGLGFTRRKMKA